MFAVSNIFEKWKYRPCFGRLICSESTGQPEEFEWITYEETFQRAQAYGSGFRSIIQPVCVIKYAIAIAMICCGDHYLTLIRLFSVNSLVSVVVIESNTFVQTMELVYNPSLWSVFIQHWTKPLQSISSTMLK